MRPQTVTVLFICIGVIFAAIMCGAFLDLGVLEPRWWWSVISRGGPLAALYFAADHYYKSKARILHFTADKWIVAANPEGGLVTWHDVTIRISKSAHGKGKNPHVTFLSSGEFIRPTIDFVYRVEEDGSIVIHPAENRFNVPQPVTVRISI